jgi:hypothetical protein
LVIAEDHEGGILIRPAIALPIENYSIRRQAEFLLSNVIDLEDYKKAQDIVRSTGLDPDTIPHYKPEGINKSCDKPESSWVTFVHVK